MRYLTLQEKATHLAYWHQWRAEFAANPPKGDTAGRGFPDPAIYDLTDRLNLIPGLVTVQSCAGHVHANEDAGMQAMWAGQLWVRLDERLHSAFLTRVYELLEHSCIEAASLLFGRQDGGDVADIVFDGLNRGPEALAQSSEAIADFFEALAMQTIMAQGGYEHDGNS